MDPQVLGARRLRRHHLGGRPRLRRAGLRWPWGARTPRNACTYIYIYIYIYIVIYIIYLCTYIYIYMLYIYIHVMCIYIYIDSFSNTRNVAVRS